MHIDSPARACESDNNSGICPEALAALLDANRGHVVGYGDDPWTEAATARIRSEFGRPDAAVFFVLNGTGANVFGLGLAAGPGKSVLCGHGAHIEEDETGAAEAVLGCKVRPLSGRGGKIDPEALEAALGILGDVHAAQPSCVSVTQPTERGELYSVEEIRTLSEIAHRAGLVVHMDGARIANAVVALGLPFPAFTCDAGVDILSFGGMKDGLAFGEAVVVFDAGLARGAAFLRKARLQLNSKMRFVSAQYLAWLESGAWKRNAENANAMAARLASGLRGISGIEVVNEVRANMIFVRMPGDLAARLHETAFFYDMEPGLSRFVTSFDTEKADVDAFLERIRA